MTNSIPNTPNPSPEDDQQRVKFAQDTLRKTSEYVIESFSEHMEQAEALADALVQSLKPPTPAPDDYSIYPHRLAELLYDHLCKVHNIQFARQFLLGEKV